MSGNSAALDTNVAVAVNNNQHAAVGWIKTVNHVYLPSPVLGERLYGAINSANEKRNRDRVAMLRARSVVLVADEETAEHYATVRFGLKRLGRPIPENDLWMPRCAFSTRCRWRRSTPISRPSPALRSFARDSIRFRRNKTRRRPASTRDGGGWVYFLRRGREARYSGRARPLAS